MTNTIEIMLCVSSLREAAKKGSSLNGRAIKALPPPPPSSLMAVGKLECWKKGYIKSYFFLNGPALYPPPPHAPFFCSFPYYHNIKICIRILNWDKLGFCNTFFV